ncbi:HEAT repeat domain-containing protein [Chitinophaga sp. GCM10012297]|uniref:HEAT repeat domain-containing protein n=1 Tax=Chitinophaga chungangae TaxID=2821488 RepID=A0ABS3YGA5_9BACT|nr:HEAT repeat domain-containing protein [Chitinophaga chungangae]MBO9153717.1 HEAT repeat domain-containing protein [Chitinophaga chungangae]
MAYYDLPKAERTAMAQRMEEEIAGEVAAGRAALLLRYAADEDTYVRKNVYLALGRLYAREPAKVLKTIAEMFVSAEPKVRQTAVNAAGEIGRKDFGPVRDVMDAGLKDAHHIVRNAVIGSVKKMGEKNPVPVLAWAQTYLTHPDKEIRREICHGIELRGRTHPQDVLPLLQALEMDTTARVRNTLVHVIGQIAYKKGCLETVTAHLKGWKNKQLVKEALDEIVSVHERYAQFAAKTQAEALEYITKHFD